MGRGRPVGTGPAAAVVVLSGLLATSGAATAAPAPGPVATSSGPAAPPPVPPAPPLADQVARLDAALRGARSCREATFHVVQTNRLRPLGQTTLHGRIRARLDHDRWTVLAQVVDDRGNGRVLLDTGGGRALLLPLVGRPPGAGFGSDAGTGAALVALLQTEAHSEWQEPGPDGGWVIHRVFRSRGGRHPQRNQLLAHVGPDGRVGRIEVHLELAVRPAPLVRVRTLDAELWLDAAGQVERETLVVDATLAGVAAIGVERALWAADRGACAEASL